MRVLHCENRDLILKSVIYLTVLILMADKDKFSSPAVVFDDVHVLIKNSV